MSRQPSHGFALTEVLVAAALLAVGLLGHLALLVAGLRAERDAANLATAVTLAADLGERIRTNSSAALLYAIDTGDEPPMTALCAISTPSDPAARAACDLDEWWREASTTLPGVTARVTTSALPGGATTLCVVTLRWSTQGSYGGQYTLRLQV